ncbi:MAG: 16S rRNA (guanine(966)-N(2))-methyltransferase RsmD [Chitinispirillaceae bacterium]|nr:16S rRNA (guanine(966)-N(2))-methyltransferase RsmD [Chitinispirillaceae bacterium]
MRIITGKYKGYALFTVNGATTRPTTDYQREVIFSMYQDFTGQRVLDLFAGTGSFGLECLSRGAKWVDFVEFSNKAISVLIKNVEKLNCGELCHIHRRKVSAFLNSTDNKWDTIFLDPPYNCNLINETISLVYERNLLFSDGILIIEHSPQEVIFPQYKKFLIKQKATKITTISILNSSL